MLGVMTWFLFSVKDINRICVGGECCAEEGWNAVWYAHYNRFFYSNLPF